MLRRNFAFVFVGARVYLPPVTYHQFFPNEDGSRADEQRRATVNTTEAIQDAMEALGHAGLAPDQIETMLRGAGLDTTPPAEKGKPRTVSTEAQVRKARPGVYRVEGVHRLYLKKTSRATGSYFLRYRVSERAPGEAGRTKGKIIARKRPEMGLGSIADVSLAKAIALAEEFGVKLRRQVDPRSERDRLVAIETRDAVEAARQAAMPTVAEAVNAYLAANAPSWKHVYAHANWFNPIERYAFPVIGHLRVDQVEPRHILAALHAADEKGVTVLGRKVRSRLKTVFDWLIAHGLRNAALGNPADAGVINAGRPKNGKSGTEHYRRIKLDDAPATFTKLYGIAADNTAIACWVFMALTAARPGEALAARWDQVDLEKKLWKNPVSKTDKPLEVPLSSPAIAILGQAKASRESDLIFANGGGGKLAHSNFAGAPKRAGIDAGTPHSWRSILRDTVEDRLGFRRETAEATLGHSLGAIERAYRRETGVEARRVMMETYAGWLLSQGADNVLAFQKKEPT
jgi:integrase